MSSRQQKRCKFAITETIASQTFVLAVRGWSASRKLQVTKTVIYLDYNLPEDQGPWSPTVLGMSQNPSLKQSRNCTKIVTGELAPRKASSRVPVSSPPACGLVVMCARTLWVHITGSLGSGDKRGSDQQGPKAKGWGGGRRDIWSGWERSGTDLLSQSVRRLGDQ